MNDLNSKKIPDGYKQTEIGVIPADWELVSYDKAFNFLRTASYSRSQLGTDGKVRYIHYGDIHKKWHNFVDLDQNLPTVDDSKVCNFSLIENGDVVIADASEDYEGIGKSVEVINKNNIPAISGLHTFLLRDKNNFFTLGFRGYIHANRLVKSSMDRLATGLKVYGVSKANLKLIQIPRPPLPEQTAIANVLSDTAALIEHLEKLIAKKKAIKQGTMQQLLTGKKRLPEFSGEWEAHPFGAMTEINKGQQLNKSELTASGEYPDWNGGIEPSGYTNKWNMIENTITISEGGNSCGFVNYCKTKFWLGGHCYALKITNTDLDKGFLYQFLKFKEKSIMSLRIGSGLPNIQKKNLNEFELFIPKDKKEQAAIATVFSDTDAEIEKLEQKLDKYRQIKTGMMQQLLTGKIRLGKN